MKCFDIFISEFENLKIFPRGNELIILMEDYEDYTHISLNHAQQRQLLFFLQEHVDSLPTQTDVIPIK